MKRFLLNCSVSSQPVITTVLGEKIMTEFSIIFILGIFTPGVIRGAFWYDSPAIEGVFWTFATFGFVLLLGWLSAKIFVDGLIPTFTMVLAIIFANGYALKNSNFIGKKRNLSADDIDGEQD